jgi:hypothetical protein
MSEFDPQFSALSVKRGYDVAARTSEWIPTDPIREQIVAVSALIVLTSKTLRTVVAKRYRTLPGAIPEGLLVSPGLKLSRPLS